MCPNIPVKQQVKMNRLSGLSGQGAQKQVRLWMAMQVRDPSSHIPGSGHPGNSWCPPGGGGPDLAAVITRVPRSR